MRGERVGERVPPFPPLCDERRLQFNGTYNTPGMTSSEGRLHYYAWAILPAPLILSFDVRTLNATAPGAACLDMLLNPEVSPRVRVASA